MKPLPSNRRVRRPAASVSAPVESFDVAGDDHEPVATTAKTKAKVKAPASDAPRRPSLLRAHLANVGRVVRIVTGVAVFSATALGASWGMYRYVSTTRRFAIKEVVVVGARHRKEAEISRAGGLDVGKNVFTVDLEQARRAIVSDPWIERATVTRKLPSTVSVEVVEREPVATVLLGGTLFLAAPNGELFKRLEAGDPSDLVVITGVGGEGEMVRDRAGVTALVKRAEEVVVDYERTITDKRFPLEEVHVTDEGGVTLVVMREPIVMVLGKPPYRVKLERAARVLAELERRKGQATTIFLDNDAHPERVVARLR